MKWTAIRKYILTLKTLMIVALCTLTTSAYANPPAPPENLDFIGGFFENGVYRCYAEPCFSIHKDAYPVANNIKFRFEDWPHWLDLDDNCQNEKVQAIVEASLTPVEYENNDKCASPISGSWRDPYTNSLIKNVDDVTVEHRVSIQEAHYFGGSSWPRNKRALFANSPTNLVVISKEQRKARRGLPANKWMPPNEDYWCDYVVHRELIARKFGLNFPEKEKVFNKETKKLYCKY